MYCEAVFHILIYGAGGSVCVFISVNILVSHILRNEKYISTGPGNVVPVELTLNF